jgi:hypothetical protein
MKTDLYTFVHKAQRVRLFDLSGLIARSDFDDATDVEHIKTDLSHMLQHLREHAAIEDKYIHPLYRALAQGEASIDVAAEFDAEHEMLEQEVAHLEGIVNEGRWSELSRAYNGFLGRYLVHLQEEEEAQEAVLWEHYDAELTETFARFQSERSPEKMREDLEFFLPALSAPELTMIFTGMKLKAPAYVFEFAQTLGEKMVRPEIWAKVKRELSAVSDQVTAKPPQS